MKDLARDAHPVAQPISARVIERHTRGMDLSAGGLAHDQDASFGVQLHHGPHAVWQVLRAQVAGADFGQQSFKTIHEERLFERAD